MEDFIYKYYVEPIWTKTGYNPINTITYAALAIVALFVLYNYFKGKINWNKKTILDIMPFVLIGSTYRVVTDSIDSGKFLPITPIHKWILESHIFDYGYFTVTPGIYIVVAAFLVASIIILRKLNKIEHLGKVGLALGIPGILLLLPFMSYWIYTIPIILMATVPAFIAGKYWKLDEIGHTVIFSQALDGAATFFVIEIFSKISGIQYFEQHVFSAGIGSIFGYLGFYLLKLGLGIAAAKLIKDEKTSEEQKSFISLIIIIMGLAPGIRDILRMMVGG
ncbi:MAG: DUF63 family protein [Candidatus Bilamarchaeum sp.]